MTKNAYVRSACVSSLIANFLVDLDSNACVTVDANVSHSFSALAEFLVSLL